MTRNHGNKRVYFETYGAHLTDCYGRDNKIVMHGKWQIEEKNESFQVTYTNLHTGVEFNCGSTTSPLDDVIGFVVEDGSSGDWVFLNQKLYLTIG